MTINLTSLPVDIHYSIFLQMDLRTAFSFAQVNKQFHQCLQNWQNLWDALYKNSGFLEGLPLENRITHGRKNIVLWKEKEQVERMQNEEFQSYITTRNYSHFCYRLTREGYASALDPMLRRGKPWAVHTSHRQEQITNQRLTALYLFIATKKVSNTEQQGKVLDILQKHYEGMESYESLQPLRIFQLRRRAIALDYTFIVEDFIQDVSSETIKNYFQIALQSCAQKTITFLLNYKSEGQWAIPIDDRFNRDIRCAESVSAETYRKQFKSRVFKSFLASERFAEVWPKISPDWSLWKTAWTGEQEAARMIIEKVYSDSGLKKKAMLAGLKLFPAIQKVNQVIHYILLFSYYSLLLCYLAYGTFVLYRAISAVVENSF